MKSPGSEVVSKCSIQPEKLSAPLELLLVSILTAVALFAVSIRPVGFMGGGFDDIQYFNAAANWIHTFPYIGTTHWELRHPFVLQLMAMMMAGLRAPSQLLAISAGWYGLILLVAYLIIRRMAGTMAAFFSCLLVASSPAIVEAATSLTPELVEFAFVLVAVSIILIATERTMPMTAFVMCGLLIGFAWLTRETAGAVLLFLLLAFAGRPMFARSNYLVVGLAAFLVVAFETGWLWFSTGDPLYRIHVDMRHVLIPSAHLVGGTADPSEIPVLNPLLMSQWVPSSPIKTNWFIDPYLAFFTSRQFGVLFYALPAAAVFLFRKRIAGSVLTLMSSVFLLGVLSFLFSTYVLAIRPQARYYIPVIFGACSIVGVYLAVLWSEKRKYLCSSIIVGIVLGNLLLCDLQQYRNYAADAIISYLAESDQSIHVSNVVWGFASVDVLDPLLLMRVTSAEPKIGDMVLIGPKDKAWAERIKLCDDSDLRVYMPRPYVIGMVASALGGRHLVSEALFSRIYRPDGIVSIGRRCE